MLTVSIALNTHLQSQLSLEQKLSFSQLLQQHRHQELTQMQQDFVSFDYNRSRYNFVHKIRSTNCSVKKNLALQNNS